MNQDQVDLILTLVEVQNLMCKPSFTEDKVCLERLIESFDTFVTAVRTSIGQHQIKEFLRK